MESALVSIDGGLRKDFRTNLKDWHWQSIETGGTGKGVPDSNFCKSGLEGWIEFKKTLGWTVGLAPEQSAWHMRRWRAGGYTLIAVKQIRKGGDVLWLFLGNQAENLLEGGLTGGPCVGRWDRPWPWPEIGKVILSGHPLFS